MTFWSELIKFLKIMKKICPSPLILQRRLRIITTLEYCVTSSIAALVPISLLTEIIFQLIYNISISFFTDTYSCYDIVYSIAAQNIK